VSHLITAAGASSDKRYCIGHMIRAMSKLLTIESCA